MKKDNNVLNFTFSTLLRFPPYLKYTLKGCHKAYIQLGKITVQPLKNLSGVI